MSIGSISLRDAKFMVGPTFTRVTGLAQGDSISITQGEADVTVIRGAMGGATAVFAEDDVRNWSLQLLPTASEVTLLCQLRALRTLFPFAYEFGVTKLAGGMAMTMDPDIVIANTGNPITLSGFLILTNKIIGAQGKPFVFP